MSFFDWVLVFLGITVLALIGAGLLGLRLWRTVKALGKDLSRAGQLAAEVTNQSNGLERTFTN